MSLLIKNGTVVDPANKICSKLNIYIEGSRITALTREELAADQVIDAAGLVVAPGFVDIHMHEDKYDKEADRFHIDVFDCMLRMGVTTAVGGNCGGGPSDPKDYMDAVDRIGLPVNFSLLVPHECLRTALGPLEKRRAMTGEQIQEMMKLTEQWLSDGCVGLSYGLRYVPGLTMEELKAINQVVGKTGKLVAAHIRDDEAHAVEALREFIDSGEDSGAPLQVSHIGSMAAYGYMEEFLSVVDECRSKGLDIMSDCYPYTAFCTTIGSATFDEGFHHRYGGRYDCVEIAQGKYRGRRLDEALYLYYREKEPNAYMVAHVMKEEEVDMALSHPAVMVGSDGGLHDCQGHPRSAGAFPRFLKHVLREKKLLSLSEAIAKMTCMPAARIGIARGTLGLGQEADIAILDIGGITDGATFSQPTLPPQGVRYVLLGGKIACENGEIKERNLGRTLRR